MIDGTGIVLVGTVVLVALWRAVRHVSYRRGWHAGRADLLREQARAEREAWDRAYPRKRWKSLFDQEAATFDAAWIESAGEDATIYWDGEAATVCTCAPWATRAPCPVHQAHETMGDR